MYKLVVQTRKLPENDQLYAPQTSWKSSFVNADNRQFSAFSIKDKKSAIAHSGVGIQQRPNDRLEKIWIDVSLTSVRSMPD